MLVEVFEYSSFMISAQMANSFCFKEVGDCGPSSKLTNDRSFSFLMRNEEPGSPDKVTVISDENSEVGLVGVEELFCK